MLLLIEQELKNVAGVTGVWWGGSGGGWGFGLSIIMLYLSIFVIILHPKGYTLLVEERCWFCSPFLLDEHFSSLLISMFFILIFCTSLVIVCSYHFLLWFLLVSFLRLCLFLYLCILHIQVGAEWFLLAFHMCHICCFLGSGS